MTPAIPVAMYHHVNCNEDFITVRVEQFEAQMQKIAAGNWHTLSLDELEKIWTGKIPPPKRSVLLTFDDAWLDIYHYAFPILKKYGHRFTVFAVGNWTEQASRSPNNSDLLPALHKEAEMRAEAGNAQGLVCTWKHLEEMKSSGLADIENHTATHMTWSFADDTNRVIEDIEKGREILRARLGIDSKHLCWPRGVRTAEATRLAAAGGIRYAYLVRRGANIPGKNPLGLYRFTAENVPAENFLHSLNIFSRPIYGTLYARLKPDRWKKKMHNLLKPKNGS